mmetsp:Transcript_18408/g.46817  ORF Transcript_18408/g.46817 Transcript_18408/m.46817 type:complete len:864 (-) Transcript_18408:146-2737(-)|eukprot:CAMPEP_0177688040 /NCGR_PEP_ID=MMETSP0447-20121125/34451_1 /TAXON_ID=0 /ORGANISM="Stygamoeba regulata, Strain BSH-02190019" /LENGTH=863 /DNA_ID=CAMNT_0019198325 /DNA_START=187 /DNA_END=2778 /DNA_ORIENTATION=+
MISDSTFQSAALKGDILELEFVNLTVRNVNSKDGHGITGLHCAAFAGSKDCVELLLGNKAEVNCVDSFKNTPLQYASMNGHNSCVKRLLSSGASVNTRDNEGSTPLHKAALFKHADTVATLIEHKADVDAVTDRGIAPVHCAAAGGSVECLKKLHQAGAKVAVRDCESATPLHKACFFGHLECAKYLLSIKDMDTTQPAGDGGTLLHCAAHSGKVELLDILIEDWEAKAGKAGGDAKGKFNVNCKDDEGSTPLHEASFEGHLAFVKRLVALGGDTSIVDASQSTPMHKAAYKGSRELVCYLMECGSTLDCRDCEGAYPIHKAAYGGHVDCIRFLLEKGADIECRDSEGASPIHKAAFFGRTEVLGLLLIKRASPNATDNSGGTALHNAVFAKSHDSAKLLIQYKANINAQDAKKISPLHIAAGHGNVQICELLLANGAQINITDADGKTPLFHAVKHAREQVVEFLIKKGASFTPEEKEALSSVNLAKLLQGTIKAQSLLQLLGGKGNLTLSDVEENVEKENLEGMPKWQVPPEKLGTFRHCINYFNTKPKKAIEALMNSDIILPNNPKDVAKFLHLVEDLNKRKIGEYLGDGDPFNVQVLSHYTDYLDFGGLDFDIALRRFLYKFRLPGEAQCIDRIVHKFASRYYSDNRGGVFCGADAVYILAFSVIMLNTDAHNPAIKKQNKMTKQQFVRNNKGINGGKDLPEKFLEDLYARIVKDEIKMEDEGTVLTTAERKGWMNIRTKRKGGFKVWKHRWFLLSGKMLYYYKKQNDSTHLGGIDVSSSTLHPIGKGRKFCFKLEETVALTEQTSMLAQKLLETKKISENSPNARATTTEVYFFACDSDQEYTNWYKALSVHSIKSGK